MQKRNRQTGQVPMVMQTRPSSGSKSNEPLGRPYCNPFLLQTNGPGTPGAAQSPGRPRHPDVLYGVLDQAEVEDGSVVLMFGLVAGDWLLAQLASDAAVPADPAGSTQFYVSMPLYLLEVRFAFDQVFAIGGLSPLLTPVEDVLRYLEGTWVEIQLAAAGTPGSLFDNLFGAAIDVGVASVQPASSLAARFLDSLDLLDPTKLPDATEDEIEDVLKSASAIDEVVVYDVGQGAANGLISAGEVGCYFDVGGGAAGNTSTFPRALKTFCHCGSQYPPIILSHWDHDHWSSEGRDTLFHRHTWIVPRQASQKKAPHHLSLISAIQTAGKMLVWPSGAIMRIGQLEIGECTGSTKNDSGLSLHLHPPSSIPRGQPVLMPADAGYDDLPGGRPRDGTLDAIVCPHHGGHSNSPQIPLPPSVTHQRLIYSYGPNNSYKHPLFKTYDAHHRKNWVDVRKGLTTPVPPSPRVVRNTEDRKSSGLGHVGFDWTTGTSLTALACGADLGVQQK